MCCIVPLAGSPWTKIFLPTFSFILPVSPLPSHFSPLCIYASPASFLLQFLFTSYPSLQFLIFLACSYPSLQFFFIPFFFLASSYLPLSVLLHRLTSSHPLPAMYYSLPSPENTQANLPVRHRRRTPECGLRHRRRARGTSRHQELQREDQVIGDTTHPCRDVRVCGRLC